MYDQLIAEDLAMTTAIQRGTMTRSQRRARIEDLMAQIKAGEEEQIEAAASEQTRQNDQLRNVVDNFRGFSY
jgi:polyhydroxyalkanoate synthesis regulator phasin